MKFNKKGQGALEYLLLIGGAVLIAVIVIALLVGMGSENATTARERNAEALEAIDTPIPSTITNVICYEIGDGKFAPIVTWTPVVKDNYKFFLYENGVKQAVEHWGDEPFDASVNPVRGGGADCLPGAIYSITTIDTVTQKSVSSNTFIIK